MPRRKNAKRAAKLKSTRVPSLQKMEKDILRSPTKIAKLLNKEVLSLKLKDARIKKAIGKLDVTTLEKNMKKAEDAKFTVSGKKKFNKAKKAYAFANKSLTSLNKQLVKNTKALVQHSNRYDKFEALRKHLIQFEKDWAKGGKKAQAASFLKPQKTTGPKTKTKETFTEAPKYDTFETITDDVNVGETTEVTS